MLRVFSFFAVLMTCLVAISTSALAQVSDNDGRFKTVDAIIEKAVAEGNIPGAVLLVGHNGKVIHRKAFGSRSLEPSREPMTTDTVFDLASLTKCIATATSVMKLVEDGRIRLGDSVATYLPDFAQNGKKDITIRDLMTHYSACRLTSISRPPGRGASGLPNGHARKANQPSRIAIRI